MGLAGCTTVSPVPPPDAARTRPSLAPGTAVRPSVLQDPVRAPSDKAALVRTGPSHPAEHRSAGAPGRRPGSVRAPAAGPRPRAVAPAAPPERHPRRRRPPGRHPAPRPRPATRPPTAAMRDLCRQADGVAEPRIVRLCHDTYG